MVVEGYGERMRPLRGLVGLPSYSLVLRVCRETGTSLRDEPSPLVNVYYVCEALLAAIVCCVACVGGSYERDPDASRQHDGEISGARIWLCIWLLI